MEIEMIFMKLVLELAKGVAGVGNSGTNTNSDTLQL
jgi:hypothetical protein